jgi:hypothetical protein
LFPAKPVIPGPAQVSDVPVDRRKQTGLLVLNAVSPPPDVPRNIPRAEARSLFAVAPGDVTVIADPGAGSKGGGQPSMAAGTGTPADVATGDAVAEAAAGGSAKSSTGSGTGTGGRYGSENGSGLNPGTGEGTGSGRGTTAGGGTGTGSGTLSAAEKAPAALRAAADFPASRLAAPLRKWKWRSSRLAFQSCPTRQTSYSMTITSTASSGGGLPDFGVFQNEKIYTVYLDMRALEEDRTPSWIMQYAVLQPQTGNAVDRVRGTPTPPYATLKQVPDFSADITAKTAHQMIVASGVLNVTGQLEQLLIKQTPDPRVNSPLIEALKNWTFQPAQVDGKPVTLKVLLGIRLSGH